MKPVVLLSSIACVIFCLPPGALHARTPGQATVEAPDPVRTENRPVSDFTGIRIESPVSLDFTPSSMPTLAVTARQDVLRRITTTVVDGQLIIRVQPALDPAPPIRIAAGSPLLSMVEIAGAADVRARDLSGKSLGLRISGSGTVAMSGRVERIQASMSGAGILDLAGLKAADLDLALSGSGQVQAFASQSAQASISGAGSVVIAGNPPQRSVRQHGSGSVVFQ